MVHDPPEQTASEITCREVAEWTSAYLDEHVNETSKVRMALHLATCAGCEAYVKQIASVRDMLGLLPGRLRSRPGMIVCGRSSQRDRTSLRQQKGRKRFVG